MDKVKKNIHPIIPAYIISMALAFTTRYGSFEIGYMPQLLIGLIWIVIALVKMGIERFNLKKRFNREIGFFLILYLIPLLIIHLYTIISMTFGRISWTYFSTNLTVYVPTTLAILAIYMFRRKALNYTIYALLLSWIISVAVSLFTKGIMIFPNAIYQGYINPEASLGNLKSNYLELHDVVLACGYPFIYFLYFKNYTEKPNKYIFIFLIIIMLLGMKRIAVLGLIMVILFYLVLNKLNVSQKVRFCKISGWVALILCYLFIYILSEGSIFYDILDKLGINSMGRNYYYQAVLGYSTFSPSFLGIGRNVVAKLLQTDLAYLKVGGVHSDIIKMYVENGFILFGLWLWYHLVFLFDKYEKKFGNKSAFLYFGLLIYSFALYTTDNIEIYFICQIFSIMIPVSYALFRSSSNKNPIEKEGVK